MDAGLEPSNPLEDAVAANVVEQDALGNQIVRLKAEIAARDEEIRSMREVHAQVHLEVDHPTDFRYIADSRGNVVRFSANAVQILGYTHDELIGHHYLEWIEPRTRNSTRRFYNCQFAKRVDLTYREVTVVAKNGARLKVGQNVSLLYLEGEIAGFQVIARVISQEFAPEPPPQEVASDAGRPLSNAEPDPVASGFVASPDDNASSAMINGPDSASVPQAGMRTDEYMELTIVPPIRCAEPSVILRTRHEVEREKLYRQAIAAADGVMYQLDFRLGAYVFLDEGIERLIGYTVAETHPAIWSAIATMRRLRGELAGLSIAEAAERFRSGRARVWSADYTVRTKQGERRCIADASVTLLDAQGEVYGCIGILQDITDRVLLQEQLLHSQKIDSLGRFAGGIAHDFNNLLTAILGYASLAAEDADPGSAVLEHLQSITYASERAADLTRQLLAFARKQVTQPTLFDLNDLIAETDQILRRLIRTDIELTTMMRPGLGLIRADRGQIQQVLINLVVNARDAMPNGGKLTIETDAAFIDQGFFDRSSVGESSYVVPGEYIILTVTDNGEGIDEIIQPHIFEPFFTTKDSNRGTGLGLATCDAIIRDNAGIVIVDSKPQTGASFKVMLPRVEGQQTTEAAKQTDFGIHGKETILFVEDNELLRRFAVTALTQYGYRVLEASHPSAAVHASNEDDHIPLLITDLIMPEMNGVSLARSIRARRPEIRILYISGYADSSVFHQGLLDERSSFLQKPFSSRELARTVRELLDRP